MKKAAALIPMILLAASALARADTLSLRASAEVVGDKVLLRDVAKLDGPLAAALGDVVVGRLAGHDQQVTISLASIQELLDAKNVNWGKLSLRGYMDCKVQFTTPPEVPPETLKNQKTPAGSVPKAPEESAAANAPAAETSGGAVVANPSQPVDTSSNLTLRDLVVEQLVKFAGVPRDELRFTFGPADRDKLGLSALRDRFEFEPQADSPVGRVPIIVRQWRGQEVVDTFHLTVDVSRRYLAVVVTRDMQRGQPFSSDDLEVREIYLTDGRKPPLTDVAKAAGLSCTSLLRKGAAVYAADVAPPVIVQRNQIITVHTVVGGLMVKVPARANEPGTVGQTIQVTNESSHERFMVQVTGPRQAVLVVGNSGPAVARSAQEAR